MRRAFTLVEMLVALAITLIMMGAVVALFGVVAESVSNSRAGIEMSDRLRHARNQLQLDLRGVTATMKPPRRPENDEGYFEIIEGSLKDSTLSLYFPPIPPFPPAQYLSLLGDIDDVLMFTTRRRGAPFLGKFNGSVIESPVAEVVYFLVQNGPVVDATMATPMRLCTLYRRVLLVAPGVGTTLPAPPHFYDFNDISVRYDQPGAVPTFYPNTLGDLTKRENRFAHYGESAYGTFPFPVDLTGIPKTSPPSWPPPVPTEPDGWLSQRPTENAFLAPAIHARLGDDVLLTNVLAFDVQVWDPGAPVYIPSSGSLAVEPSDPGWFDAYTNGTLAGYGAYVDLGYDRPNAANAPNPVFNAINPNEESGFINAPPDARIYDTWSLHYENDGIQQNQAATGPDLGTNGLDDGAPGNGIVDDITEYDTLPPYSAPLRGIRVTIRVYEPSSQQVRQAVIMQDFLSD